MVLSGLWILQNLKLFYYYHFTNLLFLFKLPDWVLVLNIILGITGIWLGKYVYKGFWVVKKVIMYSIIILLIEFFTNNYYHLFY